MPSPLKFKQGWEKENLAKYILSRFSFIAQPSTISDDIGIDYFCTLFEVGKYGKHEYAEPRNAFAIQIKSNNDNIPVSNKINYLSKLEIPYFVGVIDAQQLSLAIYSGEFLPMFFTLKGNTVTELKLQLCDRQTFVYSSTFDYSSKDFYFQDLGNDSFILSLPKIIDVPVKATRTDLQKVTNTLKDYCSTMQKSIASKISHEYIYELKGTPIGVSSVRIQAGIGSNAYFRENFYKRLAEVFYNLEWIYNKRRSEFNLDEFELYETFLHQLEQRGDQLPIYLIDRYKTLKNALQTTK